MPADYDAIRKENERKYGTEVQHYGKTFSDLYAGRTIYEILQNTEDALKKRGDEDGSRTIDFSLKASSLTITHYGKPFDEADVRGICSIARSTKEEPSDIGQFGIGFKSVYNFTSRPEIHSGDEHFAIESLVLPYWANERALNAGETQIIIPFNKDLEKGEAAKEAVLKELQDMTTQTLLFLREIEEIAWSVDGGPAKRHRSIPSQRGVAHHALNVRQVRLVGHDDDLAGGEQWIVFSHPVEKDEKPAGFVEIAFLLEHKDADAQNLSVCSVADSKLFVFFPTKETNLGFLVHGPYHTKPNRESIQQGDAWNRSLIEATAVLLVDALKGLRELGLLGVSALESLPLKEGKFAEGSLFAPMFQAVKNAMLNEPLLPAYGGGHIAGKNAKLAQTADLRGLIGPEQLAGLFPGETNLGWLIDSITTNRTPDLHKYLREALDITYVTPKWLVSRLTKEFLEAQPDEWIMRLYEFFNGQKSVLKRLPAPPLVRLETGVHTVAFDGDAPQAYLPSKAPPTGFPTVKSSVCQSKEALEFLKGLEIREPDPVDFVIKNILPKYGTDLVLVSDDVYRDHFSKVLNAYESAPQKQRQLLVSEIGKVKFAIAVDAATGDRQFVRPGDAYWPTDSLKALFKGVSGVLLLDNNIVPGESHNLLAAAGTPDRLARKRVERELTEKEKYSLRLKVSEGNCTRDRAVLDYTLMGLDALLDKMASMPFDQVSKKAELLWEALCEFSNRGDSTFNGEYRWYYRRERYAKFTACFVERLRNAEWVPDKKREVLRVPGEVAFVDTEWEANPSLAEKIGFPSSEVVDKDVAKKIGIDAAALTLLKEKGITTLAQVQELFPEPANSVPAIPQAGSTGGQNTGGGGVQVSSGNTSGSSSHAKPASAGQSTPPQNVVSASGDAPQQGGQSGLGVSLIRRSSSEGGNGEKPGDGSQSNMKVECAAIKLILSKETRLKWTMLGNPGFDLWEPGLDDSPVLKDAVENRWELGPDDQPKRWIEVKSSKGKVSSVTLSGTQFEYALKRKNAYWLYVVENATSPQPGPILKIQNPARKILNGFDFTLRRDWIEEHQSRGNTEEG